MSELTIWNGLRAKGLNEMATAALMGNIQEESGFFAPRLQGDFTSGYNKSLVYTTQVDNGSISRTDFIYNGPGGGGFGLCQWTYSTRKAGLYDFARSMSTSIGDEAMQIDHIWHELHQGEFMPVLSELLYGTDLRSMVKMVLQKYENPTDQSEAVLNLRTANAQKILSKYSGTEPGPAPEPDPIVEVPMCTTEHRILSSGNYGRDVYLLQCALKDMGYDLGKYGADGAFGSDTEKALNKMQADCNIRIDGIAGEETWQIIFQ